MEQQKAGYIYILTNPSFPQYVKIGYADDIQKRLEHLNRSECIPFAFRLYAYYEVPTRLTDIKLHALIDRLNPDLRSIEDFQGKKRVREFYNMEAHTAYSILESIAEINGMRDKLVLVEPDETDIANEETATEIRMKREVSRLPRMDWLIEQGLVHIGDELCMIHYPEETAILVDKANVRYKGQKMSFNKFCCLITGWQAVQTYAYLKVVGSEHTLASLREQRMKELGMI